MALEIERRFLVAGDGWWPHVRWSRRLLQGYLLSGGDGLTLRVRASELLPPPGAEQAGASGEAWLTLKAPPPGRGGEEPADQAPLALSRLEFEYAIPTSDAEALLGLCSSQLVKVRHGLDLPGGDWVLDVFEAANAPLVVAEVELSHAEASVPIPAWCVRELTGRHELSNAALARHPLRDWSEAERRALLG